jgi:hypothetical protein
MNPSWNPSRSKPREQLCVLSPEQRAALRSTVAELIPNSGDGFPSAAEAGVDEFIVSHVAVDDDALLRAGLDAILSAAGAPLENISREQRVEVLRGVETGLPAFFTMLLGLTYHGYYSRGAVARAIRDVLGYAYNDHPQPDGYRLPPFDPRNPMHKPATPRGSFLPVPAAHEVKGR